MMLAMIVAANIFAERSAHCDISLDRGNQQYHGPCLYQLQKNEHGSFIIRKPHGEIVEKIDSFYMMITAPGIANLAGANSSGAGASDYGGFVRSKDNPACWTGAMGVVCVK